MEMERWNKISFLVCVGDRRTEGESFVNRRLKYEDIQVKCEKLLKTLSRSVFLLKSKLD